MGLASAQLGAELNEQFFFFLQSIQTPTSADQFGRQLTGKSVKKQVM